jgi:hypothetical protein
LNSYFYFHPFTKSMMNIARAFWLCTNVIIGVMPVMAGVPWFTVYSTSTAPPEQLVSLGGCYDDGVSLSLANDAPFAFRYIGNNLDSPDSVYFILMGPNGMERTHCENQSPYFLHGNSNGGKSTCELEEWGTVHSWPSPEIGEYQLYAVAYDTPNCKGDLSESYSINVRFTIDP